MQTSYSELPRKKFIEITVLRRVGRQSQIDILNKKYYYRNLKLNLCKQMLMSESANMSVSWLFSKPAYFLIFTLWRLQVPSAKTSAKARDKAMSAESLRTAASSVDTAVIIPHIVINVVEEHLTKDELLKNASLPTLDQARVDWFYCFSLLCSAIWA